jgi:hypothetical protein
MAPLTALLLAATLALPASDPVGVWPLQPEPEVVHAFDPPDSPYGAGHRGVDLLGSTGQPVLAALPGSVTFAGPLAGRGVVVVDHGATRTTYEPVAATVTVGSPVGAGTQVGTLQLPGSHCFPRACLPCRFSTRRSGHTNAASTCVAGCRLANSHQHPFVAAPSALRG